MAEDLSHTGGLPGDVAGKTTITPPSPPGYELLDGAVTDFVAFGHLPP